MTTNLAYAFYFVIYLFVIVISNSSELRMNLGGAIRSHNVCVYAYNKKFKIGDIACKKEFDQLNFWSKLIVLSEETIIACLCFFIAYGGMAFVILLCYSWFRANLFVFIMNPSMSTAITVILSPSYWVIAAMCSGPIWVVVMASSLWNITEEELIKQHIFCNGRSKM
jgi:hypothetical protein